MKLRSLFVSLALLLALAAIALARAAFLIEPAAGGLVDGQLAPIDKEKPNNVASYEAGQYRQMAPLQYSGTVDAARKRLLTVLRAMPGGKIERVDGNYIHATFRSRVFRFVDDVEFLFVPEQQQIDFRSASRLGWYDFKANKERMKEIRQQFEQR